MKSQTPDLIWPPAYEQAKKKLERAEQRLKQSREALDAIRQKASIKCCHCGTEHPIATQEYIQTYWYKSPYDCTGGDYWNSGEANWKCPSCGYKNRFDAVDNKDYLDFYRPEIVRLKGMFKSIRECYCTYDRRCDNCQRANGANV